MLVGHFTTGDRLGPPAPMLSKQLLRYATHSAWAGGWRSRNQRCEPPQVLGDGSKDKLVLGTSRSTQSKPTELQDALQVREPHLDLLALPPRLFEALGTGERTGNITGVLMDVARRTSLLARYRSVLPSCMVPLVPSCFPPGQW
jgi:hypothetical protein